MDKAQLDKLRIELSVEAKNGINFILGALICWGLITWIWTLPMNDQQSAFWTFMAVAPMMPAAWLFSKILKTKWTIKGNPLQSLGLWLNFAQLFYFPFIFLAFFKAPAEMPMAFAIITGAHFFPYGWFYKTLAYPVMAGIIVLGSTIIGIQASSWDVYKVAAYVGICLIILAIWLWFDYKNKTKPFEKSIR